MEQETINSPLTALEKMLVDTFCAARPCQPLRALLDLHGPDRPDDRQALYAACQTVRAAVHFCPLGGGDRYRESADADRGRGSTRPATATPSPTP